MKAECCIDLLTRASGADPEAVRHYVKIMGQIFRADINRLGYEEWVERLTGKTTHCILRSMTTIGELTEAFESLSSHAQKVGISMDQQLAVICALLNHHIKGNEAGHAFAVLVSQMPYAAMMLGLSQQVGHWHLRVDIIVEMIREKVRHLSIEDCDELLAGIFGDQGKQAVVALLANRRGLCLEYQEISKITDASLTAKMAKLTSNPEDQLFRSFNTIMRMMFIPKKGNLTTKTTKTTKK